MKIKMQLNSLTHQGDAICDIFVCVTKCLASIDQTSNINKNTKIVRTKHISFLLLRATPKIEWKSQNSQYHQCTKKQKFGKRSKAPNAFTTSKKRLNTKNQQKEKENENENSGIKLDR